MKQKKDTTTEPHDSSEVSVTGIEGLDALLRGGLPVNRLYLVTGRPGAGKTTLALQYLMEGTRRGEQGLYVTLSETKEEVYAVARSHGWDLRGIDIFEMSAFELQFAQESQNTVFYPSEIELNRAMDLLQKRVSEATPSRIAIDSLTELRLLADTPLRYRRQILSLKQFLAGRSITTMLLDDLAADGGDLHVQSIAHGVIELGKIEADYGAILRRIKVTKLRGVNFVDGYHDAAIERGGFKVFPRLAAEDGSRPSLVPGLATSDVPELDTLLGGGLDFGSSCLLSGPAGTGKSSLALQFALAAARRGEKSIIYLFEESRRGTIARAASSGMSLEAPMQAGMIELVEVTGAEIAPGQFIHMLKERVERDGARIVIIDSLNGYFEAMSDTRFLKLQLHGLLSFLSHIGVVTFMTLAQFGIIGRMQAPADLTYLADTVILLRYFEERGKVLKAVSVIKKRLGGHENTLREFKVDHAGIRVGAPLTEFQGVLTGVPIFTGHSGNMMNDD